MEYKSGDMVIYLGDICRVGYSSRVRDEYGLYSVKLDKFYPAHTTSANLRPYWLQVGDVLTCSRDLFRVDKFMYNLTEIFVYATTLDGLVKLNLSLDEAAKMELTKNICRVRYKYDTLVVFEGDGTITLFNIHEYEEIDPVLSKFVKPF